MKNVILLSTFLLSFIIFSGCGVKENTVLSQSKNDDLEERREWLKEYALCECLSHISPQDTAIRNDISRAVYADIAGYNPAVYLKINSLADSTFKATEPAQPVDLGGKKAYFMSCMELFKSKKLDSLIKSYDKEVISIK